MIQGKYTSACTWSKTSAIRTITAVFGSFLHDPSDKSNTLNLKRLRFPQHSSRIRIDPPTRESRVTNGYTFDEVTSRLTVARVRPVDQGVYRCSATNHAGSASAAATSVYVHGTLRHLQLKRLTMAHSAQEKQVRYLKG